MKTASLASLAGVFAVWISGVASGPLRAEPVARSALDLNARASHVVPLRAVPAAHGSEANTALRLRQRSEAAPEDGGPSLPRVGLRNNKDVYYEVDTGSSDTWFVESSFQCFRGDRSFWDPPKASVRT
jgi:hypothetical protein